jgi:hypothetical protein
MGIKHARQALPLSSIIPLRRTHLEYPPYKTIISQNKFLQANLTKIEPRDLPSIKYKRGSLTKREACAAVNPYMPKRKSPTATKLAIYTEISEYRSLSTRKDLLLSLPPEILLLIIVELPLDSYLDFVQTSKFLREFVKTNAAYICNNSILSQFPLEAAIIPSARVNGWIVPTHPDITNLESYVRDKKRYHDRARQINEECDAYGQDLSVKLTKPGPQFLLWLQSGTVLAKVPKNNRGQLTINGLSTVGFLRWLNEELSGHGDDDENQPRVSH